MMADVVVPVCKLPAFDVERRQQTQIDSDRKLLHLNVKKRTKISTILEKNAIAVEQIGV